MAMLPTPNSLLDLPEDLVRLCMPACRRFHVSLAACRKLFSLAVEGNHGGCLRLCLGMDRGVLAQRVSLVRMLQAFPTLKKLEIHIGQPLALDLLLSTHPTLGPDWLVNVTDVIISGKPLICRDYIWLDRFIPKQVAHACPQLQRLVLQNAAFNSDRYQMWTGQKVRQQRWQPVALPHLRELVLDQCLVVMDTDVVKVQLQALPHLQCLKLVTGHIDEVEELSSAATEIVWTEKHLGGWGAEAHPPIWQLRQLTAHVTSIDDGDLKLFSELLPSLEQLEVWQFDLQEACSGELTALTHISIGSEQGWAGLVSLQYLLQSSVTPNLASLSYRGEQLRVDLSHRSGIDAQLDLLHAASLLSAVQRVGGLRPQGGGHTDAVLVLVDNDPEGNHVIIPGNSPLYDQQLLLTLIAALYRPHSLTLHGAMEVNTALVTALGQVPSLENLKFEDAGLYDAHELIAGKCQFQDEVWTRMVSMLPQVRSLTFRCKDVHPQEMILMCQTAPRRIHLEVELLTVQDISRLDDLEAAARNSLVDLELLP